MPDELLAKRFAWANERYRQIGRFPLALFADRAIDIAV